EAVVARAYGLNRKQYAHVLASFSHASYKRAPEHCLAAFDELAAIGIDAFCRRHDSYADIPLPTALPKPVLDLPIPEAPKKASAQLALAVGPPQSAPRRRRRRKEDA